ncbi:hypothetical protein [Bacillus sp. AK031]
MYHVYFIEQRNILLNQLRDNLPYEGEVIKIKGRKAKVLSAQSFDGRNVHVQVSMEPIIKKQAVDPKKKRR